MTRHSIRSQNTTYEGVLSSEIRIFTSMACLYNASDSKASQWWSWPQKKAIWLMWWNDMGLALIFDPFCHWHSGRLSSTQSSRLVLMARRDSPGWYEVSLFSWENGYLQSQLNFHFCPKAVTRVDLTKDCECNSTTRLFCRLDSGQSWCTTAVGRQLLENSTNTDVSCT